METFSRGFNDIAFSDYGEILKNRRKLGHTALGMINDDRGNTESKIITESHELHKRIRTNEGKRKCKICESPAKKRLWHRCFAVNFAILLRTPSLSIPGG